MQITKEELLQNISARGLRQAGMCSTQRVHRIITKFYCDKLTLRGSCSEDCSTCILNVRGALETAYWENAQSAYGLFTWLCKSTSAVVVEQRRETEKDRPWKNRFNEPIETDGLDLLLGTLNG